MVHSRKEQFACFAQSPFPLQRGKHGLNAGLDYVCAQRPSPQARRASNRASISMGLFGLGLPELAVIAGVGIFIFGPNKIAELGKDLGGLAGGLKKASSEFREAMQESLDEADREIEQKRTEKAVQAPSTPKEQSASTANLQEKADTNVQEKAEA